VSGFKDFESSTWRTTGLTSSLWADRKSKPRMGLETVRSRKEVTKKVLSLKARRRQSRPQQGISFPSAPEIGGPAGVVRERCRRTLKDAPVSTKNCCLLLLSYRKIMSPPRVFSSRRRAVSCPQAARFTFPGFVAVGSVCRNRSHCRLCTGLVSSGRCAPAGSGSGTLAAGCGARNHGVSRRKRRLWQPRTLS
jgi:hypothetical protein